MKPQHRHHHHHQGFFSIRGATADNYRICDLRWQGFDVTTTTTGPLPAPSIATTEEGAWTPADNARLTAAMVRALEVSGALAVEENGTEQEEQKPKAKAKAKEASLAQTLREGIAAHHKAVTSSIDNGGAVDEKLSPALGHLAEEFATAGALAAALAARARGEEGSQGQREVGADALRDAVAAATFQVRRERVLCCMCVYGYVCMANPPERNQPTKHFASPKPQHLTPQQRAEAVVVAERLRALAVTEAAKVRAAPDSPKQGATEYVLRVLELAEVRRGFAVWFGNWGLVVVGRLPVGSV